MKHVINSIIVVVLILGSFSALSQKGWYKEQKKGILLKHYNPQSPPYHLQQIIAEFDEELSRKELIHGYMNPEKNKMYCFFKYERQSNKYSLKDGGDDETFGYFTVAGVNYKGKWYFKSSASVIHWNYQGKGGRKRMLCNEMMNNDYFKRWSMQLNPDFWNTGMFSKVERLSEKYENKIRRYERKVARHMNPAIVEFYQSEIDEIYEKDKKNEKYIGMYTIVAYKMKEDIKLANKRFEDSLAKQYLTPYFNQSIEKYDSVRGIKKHDNTADDPYFILIYPQDRSKILCPIGVVNDHGHTVLYYYVLLKNESGTYDIYRWNYFEPSNPRFSNFMYGGDVYRHLKTLTIWGFSMENLDDDRFWNDYVTVKATEYTYLEKCDF